LAHVGRLLRSDNNLNIDTSEYVSRDGTCWKIMQTGCIAFKAHSSVVSPPYLPIAYPLHWIVG